MRLQKIQSSGNIGEDEIVVSFDVIALFTERSYQRNDLPLGGLAFITTKG